MGQPERDARSSARISGRAGAKSTRITDRQAATAAANQAQHDFIQGLKPLPSSSGLKAITDMFAKERRFITANTKNSIAAGIELLKQSPGWINGMSAEERAKAVEAVRHPLMQLLISQLVPGNSYDEKMEKAAYFDGQATLQKTKQDDMNIFIQDIKANGGLPSSKILELQANINQMDYKAIADGYRLSAGYSPL